MPRFHTKNQVDEEHLVQKLVQELSSRQELLFVYLHGSFVEEGAFRDMDLAVYLRQDLVLPRRYREYESELAVGLSLKARIPIDVRVLNDAPVAFRYHVLNGRLLVSRDGDFLDEFRARTWDEYCDFAPFARRYLREVLRG